MYVFLGQFCLCRPYCGGQVGEWVCTLWVSCHFETCGITLWQPYLAAIHCTLLRCWLAKRGRRPISLFHAEKDLQAAFSFCFAFHIWIYVLEPGTWRQASCHKANFSWPSLLEQASHKREGPDWVERLVENVGEGVHLGVAMNWRVLSGTADGFGWAVHILPSCTYPRQPTDEAAGNGVAREYISPLSLINPGRAGLLRSLHLGRAAA